ncbi:hypothetical protein [Chitinophaga arvensicola]|uniref:Uncharacterized protein n=1 Tax=Chitinophaga arvensicola TaxID=29529 RepID=A0A1I0RCS3_9BACT|nr:hypothetical protein [Chitinophaga arvensicola]SEW38528.1 hypothetical protein SAMN04488122_2626 [Chitinophaga arvensicola]
MRPLTDIEKRAQTAVKKLRNETLQQGNPFMIYNKNLPVGKYYMEYPDGKIKIVSVSRKLNDFVIESELTKQQADQIRSRLNSK